MKWYHYTIIAGLIVLYWKKDELTETVSEMTGTASPKNDSESQVFEALKKIVQKQGVEKAKGLERLIRWETAHFKSGQWKKGNTAGMEIAKGKFSFPYGWISLAEFAESNFVKPHEFSTYDMVENGTGKTKTFIKFPSAYLYVFFLEYLMKKRNWNFGSWYSTDPTKQAAYLAKIQQVKPKFVNSII